MSRVPRSGIMSLQQNTPETPSIAPTVENAPTPSKNSRKKSHVQSSVQPGNSSTNKTNLSQTSKNLDFLAKDEAF